MKKIFSAIILSISLLAGQAEAARNVGEYNIQNSVGLKGFDPVAIFPEAGGVATPGLPEYRLEHLGVTYLFASQKNLDTFKKDPDKYEPSYGGWCAYAMASGSKVDIQPHLYSIRGRRAHYFVAARAKQNFDRDPIDHENRADSFWKQISGEEARK